MTPTVAVVAPGSMGAGVGRRLAEHGVRVLTSILGRTPSTEDRARTACMIAASDDEIARADLLLSIVPPGKAVALAERFQPALSRHESPATYVDCNAVSPATVAKVEAVLRPSGCAFVDAGIIGGPPQPGRTGPTFYASGPAAGRFAVLGEYGLEIKLLGDRIGAASALKLGYAGITKGMTAIGCAMLLAAERAGVGEALRAELKASQRATFDRLARQVPDMYPKAYRWIAEMQEIAEFAGEAESGREIYRGIAELYRAMAEDRADDRTLAQTLDRLLDLDGTD